MLVYKTLDLKYYYSQLPVLSGLYLIVFSHSKESGANTSSLLLGQGQPPDFAHSIQQPPQEPAQQQNTHHFKPAICCFSLTAWTTKCSIEKH